MQQASFSLSSPTRTLDERRRRAASKPTRADIYEEKKRDGGKKVPAAAEAPATSSFRNLHMTANRHEGAVELAKLTSSIIQVCLDLIGGKNMSERRSGPAATAAVVLYI